MSNIVAIESKRILPPNFCVYEDSADFKEKFLGTGAILSALLSQVFVFLIGGAETAALTVTALLTGVIIGAAIFRNRDARVGLHLETGEARHAKRSIERKPPMAA